MEGADRLAVGAAQLSLAQPSGLVRRARGLAWLGIGWHVVEFGIAIGAGIAASSIALIGFGADSLARASPASSSGASEPGGSSSRRPSGVPSN